MSQRAVFKRQITQVSPEFHRVLSRPKSISPRRKGWFRWKLSGSVLTPREPASMGCRYDYFDPVAVHARSRAPSQVIVSHHHNLVPAYLIMPSTDLGKHFDQWPAKALCELAQLTDSSTLRTPNQPVRFKFDIRMLCSTSKSNFEYGLNRSSGITRPGLCSFQTSDLPQNPHQRKFLGLHVWVVSIFQIRVIQYRLS